MARQVGGFREVCNLPKWAVAVMCDSNNGLEKDFSSAFPSRILICWIIPLPGRARFAEAGLGYPARLQAD